MPVSHLAQATTWITGAAADHGHDLLPVVMERTQLARRSAQALLRMLVSAGWLQRDGSARQPIYAPGELRQVVRSYALDGLDEEQPWRRDFAPHFELTPQLSQLLHYAFTELVNNAVDHSGGTTVTISMRQTAMHLQLLVSDDGCGLFDRVDREFSIDEPQLAMFELAKGRLTTQPQRHRGHGLYFTSRLADIFNVQANHAAFQRLTGTHARWSSARALARQGTTIYLAVARDTERSLVSVLQSASVTAGGHALERTTVPLRLIGSDGLVSRAQARRVAMRLSGFRRAELDFSGVDMLGHSFVDELFRVCATEHTDLQLEPVELTPNLARMIADWSPDIRA